MEKMTQAILHGYKAIETAVVSAYQKIETGAVQGFQALTDRCIARFFAREGETVQQARARLSGKE